MSDTYFWQNNALANIFEIDGSAGGGNYIAAVTQTSHDPRFEARGVDADIGISFRTKGSDGAYVFEGNSSIPARIWLGEQATNGSNFIGISVPNAITNNVTYILPEAPPHNRMTLCANTDGTLSWSNGNAKAIFAFDGTAASPVCSFSENISSVTKTAAGSYNIYFTNYFSANNKVIPVITSTQPMVKIISTGTTAIQIQTLNSSGVPTDSNYICGSIFGESA